jgi:hypothetical protein
MPESEDYGIVPSFKPEEYVWLRSRIGIDQLRIDEEVIELPTLIQKAAEFTASAIELREVSKEEVQRAQAQVADQLRQTLTPNKKHRSETMIASEIYLSSYLQGKMEEHSKARLDAALWGSIVEALRSKNSAIRVIADLLNTGFITPNAIMDKRRKEIRNASAR